MANAFVTDLENFGKHLLAGFKAAEPIIAKIATAVGPLIPTIGPAITEVGTIITNLESSGASQTLTAAEIEQLIVTLVTAMQIKTASTAAVAPTPAPPA